MSYNKEQKFTITSAVLFIVGAIFALIQVFAAIAWALWPALIFIIAAVVAYVVAVTGRKMWAKKFTATDREIEAAAAKAKLPTRETA